MPAIEATSEMIASVLVLAAGAAGRRQAPAARRRARSRRRPGAGWPGGRRRRRHAAGGGRRAATGAARACRAGREGSDRSRSVFPSMLWMQWSPRPRGAGGGGARASAASAVYAAHTIAAAARCTALRCTRGVRPGSRSPAGSSPRRTRGSDGACPAMMSCAPSAAIIAPLSVQSDSGGMRSAMPAASARCCATSRSRAFATTPPPSSSRGTPRSGQAAIGLRDEHVDDRLAEARRDIGERHRLAGRLALLHPAGDGGLQAREAEVVAVRHEVLRQA